MSDLPRKREYSKVREAALEYITDRKEEPAVSTISSKNQISLPARLLREMGLAAGDRLAISREGNRLVLRPRPRNWVEYYGGSLRGLYGQTKADVDAYLEELREDSDREEMIEEAWTGRKPPAQP